VDEKLEILNIFAVFLASLDFILPVLIRERKGQSPESEVSEKMWLRLCGEHRSKHMPTIFHSSL
jgi:hypothetical protein